MATEITAHHASKTSGITEFRAGTCFAVDPEVAADYAENFGSPHLYEVTIHAERIADEDDLRDAADDLGLERYADWTYVFEIADHREVLDHLTAQGYQAVEFVDVTHDNGREHETVRVLDPAAIITIKEL